MKRSSLCTVGILLVLISACAPSPEQAATMTATVLTPTPQPPATFTPTLTPPPIPYDLTIIVTDEGGAPFPNASVTFPESGSLDAVLTDAYGKYSWLNLPGPAVTLGVTAQGYLPVKQANTLERGPSTLSLVLKRDPYGLLPSTACTPAEKLLYLEDFQDGEARQFSGFQENLAGLTIGPAPDEDGNMVLILDSTQASSGEFLGTNLDNNAYAFEEAVWRLRFMINAPTAPVFIWDNHGPAEFNGTEEQGTDYDLRFWPSPSNTLHLNREIFGTDGLLPGSGQVMKGTFTVLPGKWHYMEISTYQGQYQVWIDGKSELAYTHAKPLPAGSFGIWFPGPLEGKNTGILYADAISVCGLSAPFETIPPPVPVE